jgi:hypothetical protein
MRYAAGNIRSDPSAILQTDRPEESTTQRHSKRTLKTLYGELVLDKPHFREFSFKTQVFDNIPGSRNP